MKRKWLIRLICLLTVLFVLFGIWFVAYILTRHLDYAYRLNELPYEDAVALVGEQLMVQYDLILEDSTPFGFTVLMKSDSFIRIKAEAVVNYTRESMSPTKLLLLRIINRPYHLVMKAGICIAAFYLISCIALLFSQARESGKANKEPPETESI